MHQATGKWNSRRLRAVLAVGAKDVEHIGGLKGRVFVLDSAVDDTGILSG